MRRILLPLTCLGALLCGAHAACAQTYPGVALRWNSCFGDGGVGIRSFACNTNTGMDQLVGSFAVGQDMLDVVGLEIIVRVHTGYAFWPYPNPVVPLPEWWKFRNAGTCRQNALSFVAVNDPARTGCEDWSYGQAAGGIGAYGIEFAGTGTAQFVMASAVPASAAATVAMNAEYFSFELRIRHDKTVGTGACGGCEVPLAVVLNYLKVVTTSAANDRVVAGPLDQLSSDIAFWRPEPVPTRKNTWGEVKALYR